MITRYSLPVAMAAAWAAGLLIASVSPARGNPNLVTDPGFESCPTLGSSPPPDWSGTATCSNFAHLGSFAAQFNQITNLSQSVATTAGDIYDFSFWLETLTFPPNGFTASFGSDAVLSLTNVEPSSYTFKDFTVTAAAASTTISFTSNGQAAWALDDVSVTAVPAPALSPLGPTLVGLSLLARRAYRRRR